MTNVLWMTRPLDVFGNRAHALVRSESAEKRPPCPGHTTHTR